MQTASFGFSTRPFPEIARKEEGHEARLDRTEKKDSPPGGMIDNINRSLASASPPAHAQILGLGGVQAKLTLGTVGDVYEQEADRVARQVVDEIPSSAFRARNTTSEGERIANGGEAGRVQRQITVRAASDAGGEISSEWEGELERAKGGGQPLSQTVREQMERGFGADFGGVRVHTGAQADMLARSIQARAFTTGEEVLFSKGEYNPESREGMELLAHELTHVVQQNGDKVKRKSEGIGGEKIQRVKKGDKGKGKVAETEERPEARGGEVYIAIDGVEWRDGVTIRVTIDSHQNKHQSTKIREIGMMDGTSGSYFPENVDLDHHKKYFVPMVIEWGRENAERIINAQGRSVSAGKYDIAPGEIDFEVNGVYKNREKRIDVNYHCNPNKATEKKKKGKRK
ncbi:MAG: DUF4157 domain-containing protein [Nostoc sp.]|uniref:eCIS core domain-containing protein n=1 Tax=Nostoc sp. TaxID=1180 RepID=UPI002FF87208